MSENDNLKDCLNASPAGSNRSPNSLSKVYHCRLAVVGLPASQLSPSDGALRAEGVGKSALCSRFIRPGPDDYAKFGEDHHSVLSYTDFQEPAVNGDHFLYYGTAKRPVGLDGSEVQFEVVEQTELVNDFDQSPFNRRCGQIAPYAERALALKLKSLSKTVYKCRSAVQEPGDAEQSTAGVDMRIDAFAFVLDLSQSAANIKSQIATLRQIATNRAIREHPCCLMLSKCDALVEKGILSAKSKRLLDYGQKVRPRRRLKTFYTSARCALGVEEAMMYLASEVPQNKLMKKVGKFSRSLRYGQLLKARAKSLRQAADDFSLGLRQYIVKPNVDWADLSACEGLCRLMERLSLLQGELAPRKLFAERVMSLKAAELVTGSLSDDVDGDVDCEWTTEELVERLVKFVKGHPTVSSLQGDFYRSELEAKIVEEQRRLQLKTTDQPRRWQSPNIRRFLCLGPTVEEADQQQLIIYRSE